MNKFLLIGGALATGYFLTVPAWQDAGSSSTSSGYSAPLVSTSAHQPSGARQVVASSRHAVGGAAAGGSLQDNDYGLAPPDPTGDDPSNWPDTVEFWSVDGHFSATEIDGVPATVLQIDSENLQRLRVGQTLIFPIPHLRSALEAQVLSTYNDPLGVKVWQGDLADSHPDAGFILSQGEHETHLVIFSETGSFSAVINNITGQATLIDEGEILSRQAHIDDGILLEPAEEMSPPPII